MNETCIATLNYDEVTTLTDTISALTEEQIRAFSTEHRKKLTTILACRFLPVALQEEMGG